jgi:glycerophosphoryl diester phosphodiesterase
MKIQITAVFLFWVMGISAQNMIIAHRGASKLAPENTVASANLAWQLGADAVELDIHLSKDNRVMVIHDKDTKRTCSGKKNLLIEDTPSTLLRDLDAGIKKGEEFKGEKIPYLEEMIATVPEGKKLVVEIKCGRNVIAPLKRAVEKSGKSDQIIFIAFDWDIIVLTQKEFPDNKCYWLSSSKSGLNKKMKQAAKNGLAGVNLKYSIINKNVMDEAKANNLKVVTWTVDDPAKAKELFDLGVIAVTTNRPKWLKEEIAKL